MRLIDLVFRQGHLSERALVDAVTAGERPLHIDQCDLCAERAVALARWLDDTRTDAVELSDAVFTPERLAAEQHQIMRRLEQLDHPARVISFPAAQRHEARGSGRRVAVSWVGIAAAAGLVIGLVGGQVSARLTTHAPAAPSPSVIEASLGVQPETPNAPGNPAIFSEPFENLEIRSLDVLNEITPKMTQASTKTGR